MQDFNDYVKNNSSPNQRESQQNLMSMVMSLASKYDGKNTQELVKAVYEEAKKGKKNNSGSR